MQTWRSNAGATSDFIVSPHARTSGRAEVGQAVTPMPAATMPSAVVMYEVSCAGVGVAGPSSIRSCRMKSRVGAMNGDCRRSFHWTLRRRAIGSSAQQTSQ